MVINIAVRNLIKSLRGRVRENASQMVITLSKIALKITAIVNIGIMKSILCKKITQREI